MTSRQRDDIPRLRYSIGGYLTFAGVGLFSIAAFFESPTPYNWVIVGLLAAFIAVVWSASRSAHRDVRHAYGWARKLGWTIRPDGESLGGTGLSRYPFVIVKRSNVTLNATGLWRGLLAESFRVTVDSTDGTRDFYITRLIMNTPLPAIEWHPRSNHSRVLDIGAELAFESAAFNARWRVIATDLVYAHAIVHPRLMERLLAARGSEVPVTIDGTNLYTWTTSGKQAHKHFEQSLDLLADVAESIPAHVLKQYGAHRRATPAPHATPQTQISESALAFTARGREQNHLARLALALAGTVFLAPAAVVVGHRALRAVKRGAANNLRTAWVGLIAGYAISPFTMTAAIAGYLEDAARIP